MAANSKRISDAPGGAKSDYALTIQPDRSRGADQFAMREFMSGSITSVFSALGMSGRIRYFHGYCDMLVKGSAERRRDIILARERQPEPAMTRAEQLDHIWSMVPADYRGYAGEGWLEQHQDKPTILINAVPRVPC